MSLLADYNMPFAAALAVMVLLAIAQVLGLGGFEVDADGDVSIDGDGQAGAAPGALDGLFSIIGIGRVPLMAWLAVFLLVFAIVGVSIQELADSLTGGSLDRWLAALLAAGVALPLTGVAVRPLARILPRDETTAIGLDSLLGRRGTITDGIARQGSSARARVFDRYGQAHHVMVEPHEPGDELREGEEVLLVRRENNLFFGLLLQQRVLAPVE